jgi:coenzyme F420-reducing hydrogenase delta subunit
MSAAAQKKAPGAASSVAVQQGAASRSIVAFCCRECAYAAADASANARTPLPPTVRLVLVPCSGRVSPLHLLSALAEGADGVMVAGCLEGQCHYREGNFTAIDRVAFVQRLLASVGVEPERTRMFTMSAGEPPKFVAAVREMDHAIGMLPPLARHAMRGRAGARPGHTEESPATARAATAAGTKGRS